MPGRRQSTHKGSTLIGGFSWQLWQSTQLGFKKLLYRLMHTLAEEKGTEREGGSHCECSGRQISQLPEAHYWVRYSVNVCGACIRTPSRLKHFISFTQDCFHSFSTKLQKHFTCKVSPSHSCSCFNPTQWQEIFMLEMRRNKVRKKGNGIAQEWTDG